MEKITIQTVNTGSFEYEITTTYENLKWMVLNHLYDMDADMLDSENELPDDIIEKIIEDVVDNYSDCSDFAAQNFDADIFESLVNKYTEKYFEVVDGDIYKKDLTD